MVYVFFFFKQKTAYEIRKGDWSSDVCSSDLLRSVLPAVPDGPQRQDDLAQPRPRRLELHREAALVVALDLRTEAEAEAAVGRLLEVPRDVGGDHRAAWERDRDGGAELETSGRGGGDGQRQERIVLGLGRPQAVEAERLHLARVRRHRLEVVREHVAVELHERSPRRRRSSTPCASRTIVPTTSAAPGRSWMSPVLWPVIIG